MKNQVRNYPGSFPFQQITEMLLWFTKNYEDLHQTLILQRVNRCTSDVQYTFHWMYK